MNALPPPILVIAPSEQSYPVVAPAPVPPQSTYIPGPPAPPPPSYPVSASVTGELLDDPHGWFTADDYPADAKRANQQGRVTIGLYVDSFGQPTRCILLHSSGSASLDQATCRLAMERARFKPARAPNGQPTGFIYTTGTRWELTDDLDFDIGTSAPDVTKGPIVRTLSRIIIDVDKDGRGTACKSGTPGIPDAKACEFFSVGREIIDPVFQSGKPVAATITLIRSVRVDPSGSAKNAITPSIGASKRR